MSHISTSSISEIRMHALMKLALKEAAHGAAKGEVPVGAVILCNDEIIAAQHNLVESIKDATAHAEILAIREASTKLDNWRLTNCVMIVTLEPCAMCMAAIKLSRISDVIFSASDSRVLPHSHTNVHGGVCADEAAALLRSFFEAKREK